MRATSSITAPGAAGRAGWERALERLLRPVLAHATPSGARVYLPGGRPSRSGRDSDAFEAFARSLWMAGPLLASRPEAVVGGAGDPVPLAPYYRRAIVAGTDPAHPESWYPLLAARQTLVEASVVAWNLWLARGALWEPLAAPERRRVLAWLEAASRIQPPDTNWRLFAVAVHTVLGELGGRHSPAVIDEHLDRVEAFYVGDGWYADGDPSRVGRLQLDYYNAWVIHPYLLLWSAVAGRTHPARAGRIRERARAFLATFVHWFGADGRVPWFGRSATYRAAAAGIFPCAVLADACPLGYGLARRACGLALGRLFATPGPIGADGVLTLGLRGAAPRAVEAYSGPGSPYWAGLVFLALALPPEHPFWQAPEEPLPIERESYTLTLPAAGFVVHGDAATGHVQLLNGASLKFAKKYSNLAFSNCFGYELGAGPALDEPDPAGDACITVSLDGRVWQGRSRARVLAATGGALVTEALHGPAPGAPAVHVATAMAFAGDHQVRVSLVRSERPVFVREGGFACGWEAGERPALAGGSVSYVRAGGWASGIRPVLGYDLAPAPRRQEHNALCPSSAVPVVRTAAPRAGAFYVAAASLGRPAPFAPGDVGRGVEDAALRLFDLLRRTVRA